MLFFFLCLFVFFPMEWKRGKKCISVHKKCSGFKNLLQMRLCLQHQEWRCPPFANVPVVTVNFKKDEPN